MSFIEFSIGSDKTSEIAVLLIEIGNYLSPFLMNMLMKFCTTVHQKTQQSIEKLRKSWRKISKHFDFSRHGEKLIPTSRFEVIAHVPVDLIPNNFQVNRRKLFQLLQNHVLPRTPASSPSDSDELILNVKSEETCEIIFRLVDEVHDDLTEKVKNRKRYAVFVKKSNPRRAGKIMKLPLEYPGYKRIIYGEKLTKSEFRKLYNPQKNWKQWNIWNEAGNHYITHSEYLKYVLPTLFCEKYRPRKNQHNEEKDPSISHQFLTWLFETDISGRATAPTRISQNQ